MKNFYDLQQFLKSFGIIIYMKDRKHTLSMVEYEVRELRRLELISKEEFDLAYSITEKAKDTVNYEKEILNKEYERIISQLEYAQKVGLAGKDLGYHVAISESENGIQDGFNIKLTMGDEIIDFEPRINSDGISSLNIDHQESISGSCGTTMEKVMKALQGKGILITDILKNGKSVVFKDKTSSSKSSNSQDRGRARN